ncbi:MAG: hypothetical protein KAW93_08335, partial [Methanogenium sp.]|nr:hypothetical protein [Methanogenium sp.]
MHFSGVGPKVADCILLFEFSKWEVFPVDVRIREIMGREYLSEECQQKTLGCHKIRRFAQDCLDGYAGYAQEYLFVQSRSCRSETKKRKKIV